MTAIGVDDTARKRALLLHYVGVEVFDIFDTLPKAETGEAKDFEKATAALTKYFSPTKNVEFEVHKFRQASQKPGKTIDSYHTWLRQMAATCKFHDDREIKSQIIQRCTSQRLRRHALRETMTLQQTLDFGRSLEISEREAEGIESKRQNTVREEVQIVCNWQKQRGGKT